MSATQLYCLNGICRKYTQLKNIQQAHYSILINLIYIFVLYTKNPLYIYEKYALTVCFSHCATLLHGDRSPSFAGRLKSLLAPSSSLSLTPAGLPLTLCRDTFRTPH